MHLSIKEDIVTYLREGEKKGYDLGLEIEHFVVDDNGMPIEFEELSGLIDEICKRTGGEELYTDNLLVGYTTEDYTITLEPSCQFEISIRPEQDLDVIEKIYGEFIKIWEPAFAKKGYKIITGGNLPKVELGEITPDDIPLTKKLRYKYMDEYFQNTGKYGKYMMRASASTQISIDYSSEKDMILKLSLLQKISPMLMIMMENKVSKNSYLPGNTEKTHLLRIQEWDDLDKDRTGFYEDFLGSEFGYETLAEIIENTPLILLTESGETISVGDSSVKDLISEGKIDYENWDAARKNKLIEHSISMGFFHYRVKRYIEIRVADSVPIKKAMAYVALIKGLMYSEESLKLLELELKSVDSVQKIEDATDKIERDGFDAIIYDGKSAEEWSNCLLDIAAKALSGDEKERLKYLRR